MPENRESEFNPAHQEIDNIILQEQDEKQRDLLKQLAVKASNYAKYASDERMDKAFSKDLAANIVAPLMKSIKNKSLVLGLLSGLKKLHPEYALAIDELIIMVK